MSKNKRKQQDDSSSSEDDVSKFADAVDPTFHGKLYGSKATGN
jgi:hypothetical protein